MKLLIIKWLYGENNADISYIETMLKQYSMYTMYTNTFVRNKPGFEWIAAMNLIE